MCAQGGCDIWPAGVHSHSVSATDIAIRCGFCASNACLQRPACMMASTDGPPLTPPHVVTSGRHPIHVRQIQQTFHPAEHRVVAAAVLVVTLVATYAAERYVTTAARRQRLEAQRALKPSDLVWLPVEADPAQQQDALPTEDASTFVAPVPRGTGSTSNQQELKVVLSYMVGGDATGHYTSEQARRLLTSQQACTHEQGNWAQHHPCSPDTVLLGPMKHDAGSRDFSC